jgi:hypothetical protein
MSVPSMFSPPAKKSRLDRDVVEGSFFAEIVEDRKKVRGLRDFDSRKAQGLSRPDRLTYITTLLNRTPVRA